jgi:hypothetical protein
MIYAPRTDDLEAGLETISSVSGTTRAPDQNMEGSLPAATSATTNTSRTIAGDAEIFKGDFGQALFLVVNTGKRLEPAVTVPVYRPSVDCARRMEQLEKGGGDPKDGDDLLRPLLSPPPGKEPWDDFPRWKEFRWAHPGDAEVDVWERIRRECDALRPRWHAFVPFWRVAVVEERDVS